MAATQPTAEGSSNPPDSRNNNPFLVNSVRVSGTLDRLSLYFANNGNLNRDNLDFLGLCISLSRGIDFAIANHQPLDRKQELPSLIKQVCQCKKDDTLLAVTMILMISVKNACNDGWFSSKDSEELKNLAEEIAKSFCTVPNLEADPSVHLSVLSTVMSRFYPRMKLGDILFCFEAKAGSDAYVKDFLISKKKTPTEGKVRLFVVHLDMIETSSCLISPAKVNFLVNGKGVVGRIAPFVDTGPQIPTLVSHFLKYGSNLLQALGEFNGNYLVAVAHTIETQNPDSSALQDYEHHAPMSLESDSELIEGPSRISLKCPISLSRIKIPVKGWSCKHTQCFDFDNYMDINSRKPSWRCPCCNQHVCFTDMRIDQKMIQVLKETTANVTEVIVSSDWSWKPVIGNNDSTQKPDDIDGKSPKSPDRILDLTQTDDAVCMDDDIKHPQATVQTQPMTQSHGLDPGLVVPNDVNPINGHVVDDFWSDLYSYSFEPGSTNIPFNGLVTAPISNFTNSSPVLTQPSTSQFGQQHESSLNSSAAPVSQSVDDRRLLPQSLFRNPTVSNELGRLSNQVPNPIQTLPIQTPTSDPRQMSQNVANTFAWHQATSQATTGASMRAPSATFCPSPLGGISESSSQTLHPYQSTQNIVRRDNDFANAYRVPSAQIDPTRRMHRTVGQHPYNIPQPSLPSVPISSSLRQHPTGFPQDRSPYTNTMAAANRTAQMFAGPPTRPNALPTNPGIHNTPGSRTPSPRDNVGVSSQSFPAMNAGNDLTEQNWRATARMRGALTGQDYVDAFNQYIVQPSQQARAVRPVPNMNASSSVDNNILDYSNTGPPGTMHGGSGGFTQ